MNTLIPNLDTKHMPVSVKTQEGHEARVITETDQLESERGLRRYILGLFAAMLATSFWLGVGYQNLKAQVSEVDRRLYEVKTEGTIPGRAVELRIGRLEDQLNSALKKQDEILSILKERH